jgi:outer membrane protein TolC
MRTTSAILIAVAGLWLGSVAAAHADAAQSVSLKSLMDAGQQSHPSLAKRPLLASSLELQNELINRAYWPRLSLNGQASWQSEVTSIDLPTPGPTISPPSKDQYRATLELQQSIWDGGITANKKHVAESRTRVEQEKVNLEWYQLRDRILELYFVGVVQQQLRTQAETLERYLGTVVEKVQVALTNGVAIERDVLLAQARQLVARQALSDAAAQHDSALRSLQELTGTRLASETTLESPAIHCSATERARPSPDAVHRPELSVLTAQGALLDAQVELDNAADMPRLGAFATGGYGRPGLNALKDEFDFYFIGGVQLTVPLTYLYAGTHGNSREQVAVQRSLLARQRDAVMLQVHVQLETQRAELRRLDAAIAMDDELVDVRERARKQTELQLSLGTATMTDLVNDLSQEDQARSQRVLHGAQRNLACHQLAFIMGDL